MLAVAISLAVFLAILSAELPAFVKALLAIGVLACCGTAIAFVFRLDSWAGMVLLRSQHGLEELDSLARKHPKLWQKFADIGLVIGFGTLAHFLMNKRHSSFRSAASTYVIGTLLLILVSALLPLAMNTLLSMLTGGSEFATAGAKLQASLSGSPIVKFGWLALLLFGGISLMTTAGIILYGLVVANAVIQALLGNGAMLAATSPGGVPIIPGINLDLIQGVLALAVILIVHEGMHGVLARLYRLPLKSAGLIFFGFLPFGAFVDIDEKKLFKAKKTQQNSVFVAGTAANFATALIFLILLFAYAALASSAPALKSVWLGELFALIFALNMIIAAINLVPLPLFDGYYLMKNGVGNALAARAITYVVGASFLLALLPWVLR